MGSASTDEMILKTLGRIAPASVEQLAETLRDNQNSIRQKLQRLRRDGLIVVTTRMRVASRTQCFYAPAPEPEKPVPFGGHLSREEIAAFRESVRGTPFEMLGFFI